MISFSKYYLESTIKNNIIDNITDQIIKSMNTYKLFDDSTIFNQVNDRYKQVANLDFNNRQALDYRMWKSQLSKQIKNDCNQKYLSTISNLPFHLNRVILSIEFLPHEIGEYKNNYEIGGLFHPDQDYITFYINITGKIPDESEFISELKSVIVHEFYHVRQSYEAKLKGEIISIPRISIGGLANTLESIQKTIKEYLMHPLELQAYAIEYNYRHNNNINTTDIEKFCQGIFEKNMAPLMRKDNAIRQALQPIFKEYLNGLSDYIEKFKYTEY
jgi:hypothetical protein